MHIAPILFMFVIIFKFAEFITTSYFLNKIKKEKSIFIFDFLGRLVAEIFYILPISIYFFFIKSSIIYIFIVNIFIYIVAIIALTSSLYRIQKCTAALKIFSRI